MVDARRAEMRRVLKWQPDGSGPVVLGYQPRHARTVDEAEETWPGVRDAIADVSEFRPELVLPESWLVRDLRFSI